MGSDVKNTVNVIGGERGRDGEDRRIRTIDVPALYREIRKAARPITPAQRRRAEMLHPDSKPPTTSRPGTNGWLAGDADPFYVLNSRGG